MRPAIFVLAFTPALIAAPPEVAVCRPVEREVTDFAERTGRIEPSASVDVRARVSGFLDKVLFKEGSEVKKGDILFQLDDRVQRAEMTKAQAEVTRAEARLKQAEADHQRIAKLVDAKGAGRDELDKATAALVEAKASIEVARANLEVAKINLDYTRIVAPISGRIGRSRLDAGNLVRGDGDKDGALATIIVADPVYVAFDVDESTLLRVVRLTREHKDAKVPVGIGLADEEGYPRTASMDFVDPRLDADTGTVRMRAVLANPKGGVWPGQFARVRVPIGKPRKALLVPDSAILHFGLGPAVHIVTGKNVLERVVVKPGALVGTLRVIEEGLKSDEWIVVDPRFLLDRRGPQVGDEVKPRRESAPPETRKPDVAPLAMPAPRTMPDFPGAGPGIVITASYPGANSAVVEQIVGAPIEAQIDGLEGVIHRVLSCTDDGEMRLTLTFKKGTDLDKAIDSAQKRVALAEPVLPDLVRRTGVRLSKRLVHLLALALMSPDDSRDRTFVAAYAEKQIQRELARVSGVAGVAFHGASGPSRQLLLRLDAKRMQALGTTTAEVLSTVREFVDAAQAPGSPPSIVFTGEVKEPEKLKELMVRGGKEGRMVRVSDIASIEEVAGWTALTALDGKPCSILLVARAADADADATAKAVRARLAELAKNFPVGIEYKIIEDER
jgi:RND family efflux transporter MFP subunit